METPPPLPSGGSSPTTPVANADDAKLLKRARNAGRNLAVLATLATIGALAMLSALLFAKGAGRGMAVMGMPLALLAAGYWVLAVVARRGNPTAVGVVIGAMVFQICLLFIASGINAARNNTPFQPPIVGLIIPVVVLFALNNSREVLLKLKERKLWDQVFGSAKPSGNLCIIGGTLLVTGFVTWNAGTYFVTWKAGEQQKAELERAQAFIELLKTDEKEFFTAMKGVFANPSRSNIEMVLMKLQTVEQKLEVLKAEAANANNLLQTLHTYGNALRQWKNGLMLLSEPIPDTRRAQKMFQLGDKLKADALQEFDRRYAPKKPQPAN